MSEVDLDWLAMMLAQRLQILARQELSPAEYARNHGIGLRTVYRALSENRLAHSRAGRRILIPASAKIGG